MQTQKELDRMESDWEARWEDEYQEYLESLDEEDEDDDDYEESDGEDFDESKIDRYLNERVY